MRKSKKIISAVLTAAGLSLLAIPSFAAGSSGGDDMLPVIVIAGVVVVAGVAIFAMMSANKKKKEAAAAAAKAKADAEKKAAEAKIVEVEAEPEAVADAEQVTEEAEVELVEPETVEVESDEEPEPEVKYEAPVQLESVEVVAETKSEVIEVPTIEVEESATEEIAEESTEASEEAAVEEAPAAEEAVVEEAPAAEEAVVEAAPELNDGELRDLETGCVYTLGADGVPIAPEGMVIRYKWSFLGRLIYSDATVKYRYMMLRRLLLSYKKVRSNVSWNFDSYFLGRKPLVKIKVRGKYLVVYFNLDPAEMAGTKYSGDDVSKVSRYKAVPFAYKINGERKLNYAMELVRKLMEDAPSVEPEFIEPGQAKYAIPAQSFAELYNDGYIKIGGFLAVSRAAAASDEDDEDGPIVDTADAEEEDVAVVEDANVTPIEPEVFNYTPSKKDA